MDAHQEVVVLKEYLYMRFILNAISTAAAVLATFNVAMIS